MQPLQTKMHVLIAGCGPAGLLLAAALCRQGLQVAVVSPSFGAHWVNQYAVWAPQLEGVGLGDGLGQRFLG